jgi:hypothetical protein
VIARLAAELYLPVYKQLGFYRLTDEIITGVSDVLRPHGLLFVPQIHCFLDYKGHRVDLTEGNDTGKNKTIDSYDFIVSLTAEPTRSDLQRIYHTHLERYAVIEPRLEAFTMAEIATIVQACSQLSRSRCSVQ